MKALIEIFPSIFPNFENISDAFRRITLQPDNKMQLTEIARHPNLWEQDFVSRSISDFVRSISDLNFHDILYMYAMMCYVYHL